MTTRILLRRKTVRLMGLGLATVLCACTVQKKEDTAAGDSAAASAARAEAAAVAESVTAARQTSASSSTASDSPNVVKPAPNPAKKSTATGGERDSATQPVFEIGPDGKIRRVKK